MATLHTFEWLVRQLWPNPDEEMKKELDSKRDHLLKIRNENERLRFVEEIMREAREMRKRRSTHA